MLVLAFLNQAIEEIHNDALAARMVDRLSDWMKRRRG